jgi:hypothetical protein
MNGGRGRASVTVIEIEMNASQSDNVPDRGVISGIAHSMSIGALGGSRENEFASDLGKESASIQNAR